MKPMTNIYPVLDWCFTFHFLIGLFLDNGNTLILNKVNCLTKNDILFYVPQTTIVRKLKEVLTYDSTTFANLRLFLHCLLQITALSSFGENRKISVKFLRSKFIYLPRLMHKQIDKVKLLMKEWRTNQIYLSIMNKITEWKN